FQAEDGIRDGHVTGVQTCALPIYAEAEFALELFESGSARRAYLLKERVGNRAQLVAAIEAVAGGGSVVDPKIVDTLIAERSRLEDRKASCRERVEIAVGAGA